jgi:rod shape-determining protein MreB
LKYHPDNKGNIFSSEYFFVLLTQIISKETFDYKQYELNMVFSFLTQELAIDLVTANTVIFQNDQIVLDEPSIVAIDNNTGKCIALGQKAKLMHERVNPGIKTIRPLRDGVIADFNAAEMMIRGFIKQVNSKHRSLFNPNLRIVVGIPSGSTEVEIRAVRDSSEHAGGRDVFLIYEPMAAALGIGLDVEAPKGNMVVDIGGGTTEIAVISLGGIVEQDSIRTAGDEFTADIQNYLKQQHNIRVGEITAEKIKIAVGAVIPELDDEPEPFIARGPNLMTAHPVDATITYQEIAHCLDKSVAKIEASVLHVLEQTPPELYSDIVENGIFLSGGGALLRGLDKRLSEKVNIPFHVAEDPLRAVARGTCIALKNAGNYSFLMR